MQHYDCLENLITPKTAPQHAAQQARCAKKHLYTCKCLCINLTITSSLTLSVLIVDCIEKMNRQQEKLLEK